MEQKQKQNDSNTYDIRNILGFQKTGNNEFYTPRETVEKLIDNIITIPLDKVIWCPFDSEESYFVRVLEERGYKVLRSHIDEKQDFFKYEPEENWDFIISNPPFTKKRLLIERCLDLCKYTNKDFILLYGATIFSQSMGDTLNRCSFYFLQNNVKFITNNNTKKSFQCCWVSKKGFIWE